MVYIGSAEQPVPKTAWDVSAWRFVQSAAVHGSEAGPLLMTITRTPDRAISDLVTQLPSVSVVIPCLNEVRGIATCVRKAKESLASAGVDGEVIVVDNGSTDNTAEAAQAAGATVVFEPRRGYGSAYLAGFKHARGDIIVIGDGDDTYDFLDIPRFIQPLLNGDADFIIGNRLGGDIQPGAMSWSHRWIGNPILSGMLRLLFRTTIADSHCGMRAFSREALTRMRLQALGMEFASEMVVSALREELRIVELPIAYYPRVGESKLQGARDAWRHARFMLMFSPSFLFLMPGLTLISIGLALVATLADGPRTMFGRTWDYHPLLFGAAAIILGYNLVLFDLLAKSYAVAVGFARPQRWDSLLIRTLTLERGLVLGTALLMVGFLIEARIVLNWVRSGYGALMAVREVVIGMAALVLGLQTIFASFLIGLMQVRRE